MKYSQANTKPSYTLRKLIGGVTQQSAQPEPQNSAGMWHGEVNVGREKQRRAGSRFCVRREEGDGGDIQDKHPSPKAAREKD